jgi:hypothetical protein
MNNRIDVAVLLVSCYLASAENTKKRVLLHDDSDVLHAISNLQAEVNNLKTELHTLKTAFNSAPSDQGYGNTYIRWGRTVCPGNGSEFVYRGYMAGDKWDQGGGGSNNLCIPEDPTWGNYVDGYNGGAEIRGTELEADGGVSTALFGKQTNNHDIPCTVCRSSRSSHIMIPGRANCYSGWIKEYGGYVISSYPGWKANSDYVCLDEGFEFIPHGSGNDNDHVLMPVEVRCGTYGSLPCPPYVDGRELACVVCTK